MGLVSAPVAIALLVLGTATLLSGMLLTTVAGGVAMPNLLRRMSRRMKPADAGLHPESVQLPDGCPAWWIDHPTSTTTVVVSHGRSRDRRWMLPLIQVLAKHHRVLALDFPSHGANRLGTTTNGWRESLTVDAAVQWLADERPGPIVLYGCSMGGAASLFSQARQHHPMVIGVVTDGTYAVLADVFERVRSRARIPRTMDQSVRRIVERMARYRIDDVRPVDVVSRLHVPARFLHGDRDPLAPPSSARALESASDGHGEAVFYPGGHDEPNNAAMQALVLDFIAHCERRHARQEESP